MPEVWRNLPFGELYAEPSRNGLTVSKAQRGAGLPMVNMRELFAYDFISDQATELVPVPPDSLSKWRLLDGDLLFGRRSLTLEGAGKCSIVVTPPFPMVFESSLIRVRLDKQQACSRFFYYLFKSRTGRTLVETIVEQVAVAGIRSSDLARLKVPVPPIQEQCRIAGVLGAIDDLIGSLEATCHQFDQLQRAIFCSQWDGFTRVPLSKLGTITMGQSPPGDTYNETGDGLPFYQGVKDFGLRHPTRRVYCTAPTRLGHKGDVLIAVRAPIGDTNVATEDCAIGRGLAALASGQPSTTLQALRCDPNLWSRFQGDGTVFAAVNKQTLAENRVPWVDDHRLEMTLEPMDVLYRECWNEANQLRNHRDELLPLLMSGRVRVKDVAA